MIFVATFGCQMKHVGRVSHRALDPVGDVLSETAAHLRIESHYIVFAQRFESRIRPIPHRHHDRFLVHFELARFGEVQATFPGIAKTVRPLARIAILLVPDVFFSPEPSLFAHGKNQFEDISVPFAVFRLFLDIQDK